jgi:hypothetical protein
LKCNGTYSRGDFATTYRKLNSLKSDEPKLKKELLAVHLIILTKKDTVGYIEAKDIGQRFINLKKTGNKEQFDINQFTKFNFLPII